MKKKADEFKFDHLRQQALNLLVEYKLNIPDVFDDKMRKLIFELEINRIELELQNKELRKSQLEVEKLHLKYSQLYEAAPIGYLTLDDQNCIIDVNKRAAEMLFIDKKQLIGQKFANFVDSDHQDVFYLHQHHLKQFGKRLSCNLYLKTVCGTDSGEYENNDVGRRYVQLESVPKADIKGMQGQTLMIMTDTSVLHQTSTSAIALNKDLTERDRLQTGKLEFAEKHALHSEKMAAIGTLAASIAHELNNPLQGVMNVIKGVGRRAVLEQEDAELVEIAVNECKRMADLLSTLRDFNRPTSGTRAPIHLQSVLDSILLLFKKEFVTKKIAVDIHYDNPLSILFGVEDQIKQVVMNLIKNSVDACPDGGKLSIGTTSQKNCVIFEVSDNGVGIAPSIKDHIFEPFFSTKSEDTGTGLGLSVSYGIIKNHNGTIQVASIPNKMTTFRVTLPVRGAGRKPTLSAACLV